MKYFFLILLAIPFLYINVKIFISDIKEKKIPNKYLKFLLILLPVFYIYLFYYFDINITHFLISFLVSILVSFVLYYLGVWSAGDAKYLLVLSLYIPNIGMVPFLCNIAIITLLYLLLYFLWFYLGKCLFNKQARKNLYKTVLVDLKEKWKIYKNKQTGGTIFIILKWILVFLVIFVSIRITRLYLIRHFFEGAESQNEVIITLLQTYNKYLIIGFIVLFTILILLIRKIVIKASNYLVEHYNANIKILKMVFIIIIMIFLLSFIIYEYKIDKESLIQNLYMILTYYIVIYLVIKIFRYTYKITFQLGEQQHIDIKDLKEGEIVDKQYLLNLFGEQACLGYGRKDGLLSPSPKNFFMDIENPIDEENVKMLKEIYQIVNNYHSKNIEDYQDITTIKTLNTFAFGGYIFIGFLITFFFGNSIFDFIFKTLFEKIFNF